MCYKLRSQYKKMRYHCQVCQHINNDIADVCIICLMPLTEFKIKYIPCFNIDELVDIDFRYKIYNLIIKKVKKRAALNKLYIHLLYHCLYVDILDNDVASFYIEILIYNALLNIHQFYCLITNSG